MIWHWILEGIDGIRNEGTAETTRRAFEDAMETEVRVLGEVSKIEDEDIKEIKVWRED